MWKSEKWDENKTFKINKIIDSFDEIRVIKKIRINI